MQMLPHPSKGSLLDSAPRVVPDRNHSVFSCQPFLADLAIDLMDTIAQLRSEVYVLKFAPPVPPTPATWTQSARPRPAVSKTTKVQRNSGVIIGGGGGGYEKK